MPSIKFFWREFKSNKTFNSFFILCLVLGMVGLLLVESFRGGVEEKIAKNAKNFIAADLSVSARRDLNASELSGFGSYIKEKNYKVARWIESYSLVTKVTKHAKVVEGQPLSKLADLNFVSPEFPFYGSVTLEDFGRRGPGGWAELHSKPVLWISRDLAWELGLKRGDFVKVGEALFEVGGIVLQDQFSSFRGFNLAPKIFLSIHFLAKTELIKYGSTATYSYALKLPENASVKKIQGELRAIITDKAVKVTTPEDSGQQIARSLNLLSDYLSLITLMTYLLSLVGLYYFTQHFLSLKLKTFSIYKALGFKSSFLFKVNFAHLILLTILSVLLSTSAVLIILPFVKSYFSHLVKEDLLFHLRLSSFLRILALSIGGSLLALGPLFWGALQTPVSTVFQDLPSELKRLKFYYFIPLFIYVIVLAIFLSNSIKVGLLFVGALAVIIVFSGFCFKGVTLFMEKKSNRFSFINRHAALSMSRYFSSTFTIFICLFLGMTLTTFIFQLESSLRSEFTQADKSLRPDLFMFDLQDGEAQRFEKLVQEEKWQRTMFAPMIRARMLKINGVPTQKKGEAGEGQSTFQTREDENSERMRNRGVNLSYRSNLSWSEKVVDGFFNGNTCDSSKGPCDISLELSYARRLGVKLGDRLVFDVSGIEVEGIVRSLRKVKWTSLEPNFFILFQPGVLEEAPKTYLSSFKVSSLQEKQTIFAKMAEHFPTVSILEVAEVIRKITTIFDLMALAIKFISLLSLFVVLVVLVAVSFSHLELRKKEMNLFYLLGLARERINKIFIREFSFVISLCVFLSLLFGSGLTILIMKNVFRSEAVLRIGFVVPVLVILALGLHLIVHKKVRALMRGKKLI